ncbi:MAG: hypothetical protein ACI4DY_13655 [Monoglobaceae bacterium]
MMIISKSSKSETKGASGLFARQSIMKNRERFSARRYDTPNRCRAFTDNVYSGLAEDRERLTRETYTKEREFYPPEPEYNIYFGELHGHTEMSDGKPTVDEYFINIRDNAKLDFAAITDHDHGGIGKEELFGDKWEYIKKKTAQYNESGKFTTILGYERDSYPWYNNMIVYYNRYDGDMILGEQNGEISKVQLRQCLERSDLILVPHDTYSIEAGADLSVIDSTLFTPLLEIYSRGDSAEYFGNPQNIGETQCEGGFWHDALKRGAKMGVIAASDDHLMQNGIVSDMYSGIRKFPGITAVLARENTLPEIFDAIKNRRCYGFMGSGKIYIDFRINGHYMGEEFSHDGERSIYYNIKCNQEIDKVTLVKNCRDYMIFRRSEQLVFDYLREQETDYYYLRVQLTDGRCGWTSPIWITASNLSV